MTLSKICTKCGIEKPLSDFSKSPKHKFGVHSICKKCKATYRAKSIERYRETERKYREAHREDARELDKKYRNLYPDVKKLYKNEHLEQIKATRRRYMKKKRSDAGFRVSAAISTAIGIALNGNKNGRHWETLVNFTLDELKKHLENKFKPGMSWDNYGKFGWHIDHIIPKSAFNFETPEDIDFNHCWALSNLQPLWAKDNLTKHNKLENDFQPSLLI
jgi:hypothetical protein